MQTSDTLRAVIAQQNLFFIRRSRHLYVFNYISYSYNRVSIERETNNIFGENLFHFIEILRQFSKNTLQNEKPITTFNVRCFFAVLACSRTRVR